MRAHGERFLIREHQLPRQISAVAVEHEYDAVELARRVFKILRHHQLKQRPAKLRLIAVHPNLLRYERLHQTGLALLYDGFSARALADVYEAQPLGDLHRLLGSITFGLRRLVGSRLGRIAYMAIRVGDDHARPVCDGPVIVESLPNTDASI